MSVTVILPEVSTCEATACTYNANHRCHAPAITIGDAVLPMCDTFMPDSLHVAPKPVAGVGACKVLSCVHNRDRACHAASIDVAMKGAQPDCTTYQKRSK
ncbi:DUF1540 domain-containing protein [Paraliomyxa miuraensis]|uniref:DUF1540 domain-containing protein n=1 Tax=Paraliomyxa miuraensis TaxID=376150 RepID=UPI002254C628|nr:DUF1540 domain-containing protein [Paraliomyxa miuraensis]MCX4247756.1 DUF1540 domain-containing protein [Paraliomyxa miuraensis]